MPLQGAHNTCSYLMHTRHHGEYPILMQKHTLTTTAVLVKIDAPLLGTGTISNNRISQNMNQLQAANKYLVCQTKVLSLSHPANSESGQQAHALPKTVAKSAMRTYMPCSAWRKYTARGSTVYAVPKT